MQKELNEVLDFVKKDLDNLKVQSNKNVWEIEDKNDLIFILGEKLIDKSYEIDNFTECEKIFYLCKSFDDEAQSSGDFYSFYSSELGIYAYDIDKYFEIIGAKEISKILNKINGLFNESIPFDSDERDEYISNIYEEFQEELDEYYDEYSNYCDKLQDLLYDYAIKNKEKFNIN